MKAMIKPGYDKNRQKLADIVPLDAPFTMFIASTQTCNFRCFYCTQSLSKEKKEEMGFQQIPMSDALFDKIVDDAKAFDGKIKRVVFTGLGEPLANPNIAQMIQKLSKNRIAGGYEIITNAYLLTHEMTDRLLEAGLTFLRVSIQGLTAKKYKETTGVEIDYDRLLDNIRYFYEKKGECKLYVKIMDACFDEGETQDDFFRMFGDICDHIYIEHLVDAQPGMAGNYGEKLNEQMTFYGDASEEREVCPYMFYSLQIDAVGNTFPCPPLGLPADFSIGNVNETSLWEIWHSKKLYQLYELQLTGRKKEVPVCYHCENYKCFTPKEDNLDEDKEQILQRLKERKICL
jgi:MoaA/NifB/PqqE/SkfB family radical SAM enzyme